jgi:hypothetical protein
VGQVPVTRAVRATLAVAAGMVVDTAVGMVVDTVGVVAAEGVVADTAVATSNSALGVSAAGSVLQPLLFFLEVPSWPAYLRGAHVKQMTLTVH